MSPDLALTVASKPDTLPRLPAAARLRRAMGLAAVLTYLLLAAEMAIVHTGVVPTSAWKMLPVGYCLWMAFGHLAANPNALLTGAQRWILIGLAAAGLPLAALGVWFHWRAILLAELVRQQAIPPTVYVLPSTLALASSLSILAYWPTATQAGSRRLTVLARLLASLGLVGTGVASALEHTLGGGLAAVSLLGGAVLPIAAAGLLMVQAWRPDSVVWTRACRAACTLGVLAAIAGAVFHALVIVRTWAEPGPWLIPQAAPIGGPVMLSILAGLGWTISQIIPFGPDSHGRPRKLSTQEEDIVLPDRPSRRPDSAIAAAEKA